MTIQKMQEAILAKGLQFQETVFNDGGPNCYIRFTQSKHPCYFIDYSLLEERAKFPEKGWGRFQREHAWRMAYYCIVLGIDAEMDALGPK